MKNLHWGTCRLCGQEGDLLRSHSALPAGLFRRLRKPNAVNPNPVLLTKNVMVHTSSQPRKHLFCFDCEELLNKGGENWFFLNCLQPNGDFPLREALEKSPTERLSNGTLRCHADKVSEIDIRKLTFFAASVFWRASISGPLADENNHGIDLGPLYNEQFRQYLLGSVEFPTDAILLIMISPSPVPIEATSLPSGKRLANGHFWRFTTPGIMFDLGVGLEFRSSSLKQSGCFVRSAHHYIFVSDLVDRRIGEAKLELQKTARILV